MRAWLLCLAIGCGPAPMCTNDSGLELLSAPEGWTCAEFQRTEELLSAALQKKCIDDRLSGGIKKGGLAGYRVTVRKEAVWTDEWHRDVSGLTDCTTGNIDVGGVLAPSRGALAHEMVHGLQRCNGRALPGSKDPAHDNWDRDGINPALGLVTNSPLP